ncbi:GyrI-like domain-containing protein [Luteolibacter soli]|uniref:GyrI-like domain-containing protein n=1 Tax=Luteolibacter soli TaxID=3135280 RepID=A0ABU9ATF0_9BACT
MNHSVHLASVEAVPTAVVREQVKPHELSKFVPAACGEVWSFVRAAGLPKPGRHVALYLKDHQVEVGAEVTEPFVGDDRVHYSQLPAGQVATTTHFGPYSGLGEAHDAVRRWCAENGQVPAGICWEIYGHWEEIWNADPSQIRTDVFYLLQEQAS